MALNGVGVGFADWVCVVEGSLIWIKLSPVMDGKIAPPVSLTFGGLFVGFGGELEEELFLLWKLNIIIELEGTGLGHEGESSNNCEEFHFYFLLLLYN
mgnify:CR=1 FL=1|tara:strand:- start:59 stop:352 length:294 start_codon:yes stop_codon:yes gene_type:complete